MPHRCLTDLVDALIARVRSEQPNQEYVLHMPMSVALQLPGVRTGLIDPQMGEAGELAAVHGSVYGDWEVVAWATVDVAEKVTASPLLAEGDTGAPSVYVLDLLSGEVARR